MHNFLKYGIIFLIYHRVVTDPQGTQGRRKGSLESWGLLTESEIFFVLSSGKLLFLTHYNGKCYWSDRVAEVGSLSSTAKNPTKPFIERAFANVWNKNAHFLIFATKKRKYFPQKRHISKFLTQKQCICKNVLL